MNKQEMHDKILAMVHEYCNCVWKYELLLTRLPVTSLLRIVVANRV